MRLNRRQHATNRRLNTILKDEFEADRDEPISDEMQKAIEETKLRIAAAFADGNKVQATLRQPAEAH